ncbi:polysaccharide biosynthesis/export family protein [Halopseudomonas salegens]|uniref:Polysaccharide export outer membrane protein n=1 Tax=Halopseudomonas salegens TaxID=1434072 RepID=A0A1H2FKY6_9GAMM|nr:polysaccharide biosynthesis/export family protein [Halopseudomonas salegens]SDU08027.1 polysaccharide export outer membrane protein [Halopseudomonas salegens]
MAHRIFHYLLLGMVLLGSSVLQAQENSTYRLSSGDVISINVFGEEDLSFEELRLNDAGIFSFPFLGEIRARGLTASQLEDLLTERLKGDYLISPRVSISVLQYREFFISGEVREPGGYPYQPGLTLRRAIALAGGMTERASTNRITIIRDQSGSSEKGSLDSIVMPGDTITIDQGFF